MASNLLSLSTAMLNTRTYSIMYNDVDLVKKFFFNENNYRLIEHDYSFFRNSEITVTHYKSAFKYIPFYNNNNNKTTFSNLIVQESV